MAEAAHRLTGTQPFGGLIDLHQPRVPVARDDLADQTDLADATCSPLRSPGSSTVTIGPLISWMRPTLT